MPTYAQMYSAFVADEFVTVAQLRAEMATILARLGKARHIYVLQRGEPRAVLLDIKEYEALIDELEFLDDSLEVHLAREREAPGEEKARPFDEVVRDIRARHAATARKQKPLRKRARVSG